MAKRGVYGKLIYEYLNDIYNEFETLHIQTLGQLRTELEKRVKNYVIRNQIQKEADSILERFVSGTRDQQCSIVIVNDFKRPNFTVPSMKSKFNLFYYSEERYLLGFSKHEITGGEQENLLIGKFDQNNLPIGVKIFWKENGQKRSRVVQ